MESKIEVREYNQEGFSRIVTFDKWTIAILNYIEELEPLFIDNIQAHLKTDESFVLLQGRCILYLFDVEDGVVRDIQGIDMEPNKVYNIKKGVYHTHTLTKNAKVLIVENECTDDYNSPTIKVGPDVQNQLDAIRNRLWE